MFKVPAASTPPADEPTEFPFQIGGKSFKVKRAKFLSIGEQVDAAKGTGGTIDTVFGPPDSEVWKAVRALDDDQYVALMKAYNDDSGVTPGESQGSSD